jgi:diguanylate cyclase (GGDEF)-like protein/putative nucleotidyltransferase with HDIG domain
MLASTAHLARQSTRGIPLDRAVDALLMAIVSVGAGIYFVAVPGFDHGDAALTGIVVLDLGALFASSLSVVATTGARRRMTLGLLAMTLFASAGDALVSLTASGELASPIWVTGLLWVCASVAIAVAAGFEDGRPTVPALETELDGRWVYARVVAPLGAVLAFPAMGLAVWLADELDESSLAYFGTISTLLLVLAFGRQARLLIDNRRAIRREVGLRQEVMRRNEDLEALTELATTMTQTLEELPIIERGLEVLHLAAKSSSGGLHAHTSKGTRLVAAAGEWQRDATWIDGMPGPGTREFAVARRGGREILMLPLAARGADIGVVTLMRSDSQPFAKVEIGLLRILADQFAIAIQNARDYREKLEQAVRDPLTGLYNRRYFFEALEKEVKRAERYGSHASLVIFDVDDFKQINDTLGHLAGDEALRAIARIVADLIRDVDSFARIGGEEFALLLPQTQQLDALLVAERVRTAISRQRILPGRRVTVSGGVSSCPRDGTTREALEQKADAALYWAKRNGKNICALSSEATERTDEVETEDVVAHLTALVSAIDASHLHTRDHSENVAAYTVAIAQELGLDADRIMRLRRAGLLHDVGKVAVPSEVLEKPGALEPEEFEQIKLHSAAGATMLLHAGLVEEASWVRAHHERLDGRGYPDGLAGDEIPLEARILFVADAFEAMTSDRPYREGTDVASALAELHRCAGTQFDPAAVAALSALVGRGELQVLAFRAGEIEV